MYTLKYASIYLLRISENVISLLECIDYMCEYEKGKESIMCVTECIRENENIGKRETQNVFLCVSIYTG